MMYRLDRADADQRNPHHPHPTPRMPGNVPYLVDNLWEWARPQDMPSRRHSVYASPTAELARASGGATNGRVFRVAATGAVIVQLPCQDARFHPDVRALARLLLSLLPKDWPGRPVLAKLPEALLWTPGLSAAEVEAIFAQSALLQPQREAVRAAVTLWRTAVRLEHDDPAEWPSAEGEIFFQAAQWSLLALDQA